MTKIINNIATSLKINNNILLSSNKLAKSTNKISTGLKINNASDDAAGLAISKKMEAQIRGLNQAERNIQDGISLTQVAEGAMQEQMNIVQRIRELAVQSSTSTYSTDDRKKMQLEVSTLVSELDQIATETKFNGINILNGDVFRELDKIYVEDALNGMVLPESLTNFFTESKFNDYEKSTGATVNLDFTTLSLDDIKSLNNTGFQLTDGDGNILSKFVFTENVDEKNNGIISIVTKSRDGNYLTANEIAKNIASVLNSSNQFEYISTSSAEINGEFKVQIKNDSKYVGEASNNIKFENLSMNSIPLPNFINESTKFTGGIDGNKASIELDFSDYNDEMSINKLLNKSIKIGNEIFVFKNNSSNIDPKYKTINIEGLTTNEQLLKAISEASFTTTADDNGDYVKAFNCVDLGSGKLKIEYVKTGTSGNKQSISNGIDKNLSGKDGVGLVPPKQDFTGGVNEKPPADLDDEGVKGKKASYTLDLSGNLSTYIDKGVTLGIGSSVYSKIVFTSGSGISEDKESGIISIGLDSGNLDFIKDFKTDTFIINGEGNSLKIEYRSEGTLGNSFDIIDGIKGYDDIKSLDQAGEDDKLVSSLSNLSGGVDGTKANVMLDFSSYDSVEKIKELIGTGFTLPNGNTYIFTDGKSNIDRGTAIDINSITSAKDLTNKIKTILGYNNYDYTYSSSTEIKITYHKSGSEGDDKNISQVVDIKEPPIKEFDKMFTGGKDEDKAQITMDFGAYFLSQLDLTKNIPSQLEGKGFRIDCATCENEWINIQFVTDNKDIHPDNIGININGVKTAEDLVKAIMNQTEEAGKLNHYTHFSIDKDDSSKLIVYDNRTDRGNNGRLHDGIKTKKVEKEVERYMSTIIIQSGANSNEIRTIEVLNTNIEHLFNVLSKDEVSVEESNKAKNTILLADNAINYLNKATTIVGTMQNTLEITSNLAVKTNENLTESKSKITDVDMGKEILKMTKNKLLLDMSQKILSLNMNGNISTMKLLTE